MVTAIVDYESGNLHSAEKAFQRMSSEVDAGDVVVTSDPDLIRRADRVVLPGDGAFPACRAALFDHRGVFEAMEEAVLKEGRPFFGICIGMQMLATRGLEYTPTPGFDWIPGEVDHVNPKGGLKVPHMGWNDLHLSQAHPVLKGLSSGDHAYFVHSYQFGVRDPAHLIADTEYGGPVTAIVGRDTMVGTQFHPEKSQATGLRLIRNFLTWSP
ncbi:MAG: imidazole glycerol phosphate synthase subunit HisH [Pseudomonadota bacterium]